MPSAMEKMYSSPGIMEHVERAGVHSGDSIAVYPAWNLNGLQVEKIISYTRDLALSIELHGDW